MSAVFSLHEVTVAYDGRTVVGGVTLELTAGQIVGLIGPNGAGKTSLLKACASLVPVSGRILLKDKPLTSWPRKRRARTVGYLAQERAVLWPVSAARLVALGRLPHLGPWDALPEADAVEVTGAMRATDILHLADRPVTELSGGELTRVLVARLMAGAPEVLLADEPVSGLDPAHALQVLKLFRDLAHGGRCVVVVLHDLTLAARFCDRLILMDAGAVAADGAPLDVLTPENLARCYGVRADIVTVDGAPIVVARELAR